MSERNETIADIVAAKRREAQRLIESAEASAMCGETMAGTPYTEEDLEFARQDAKEMLAEADRLEAAMKREAEKLNLVIQAQRIEIDAEQDRQRRERGDAAALRDALEEATERLIRIVGCDHYTFHRNKHHCDFKTTMGECRNKNICETIFKAKVALAAPARNCDKYATYDAAKCAWYKEPIATLFSRWLFAQANEKGDDDASK